ncbi:alpha/beta-hydrolase [Hysterangium stoloniferum]|nr:alpha/beta-hydrolase [Hysterangium stoloniferum]
MMQTSWKAWFLAALTALSSPTTTAVASLDAKTSIGTFRGVSNSTSQIDIWRGIPYAQAPVGNLRFKSPVAITTPFEGIQDASKFGDACSQPVSDLTAGVAISENCLFLNIFRPSSVTSKAKVPVLVFFHGGAYMIGAGSTPSQDPTFLLSRSVTMKKPIIFITVNYRVNTFGFLSSANVPPEDLNVGLQDQTLVLQFIKDEISAFGGDPAKVTIWGQSAGAGAVEVQVLFPANKPLFRAGILDSSTGPFKSAPFAAQYDEPGKTYARLIEMVGCHPGPESVECLRQAPFDSIANASAILLDAALNGQAWQPTPGGIGNIIPRRQSAQIASGNFLKVPLLWGTNLNEGATFSRSVFGLPKFPTTAQEDTRFDEFIGALILDNRTLTTDVLDEFHRLYPANDPSLGGRFNTGDSLFDRAEAWYTDFIYLSPRRLFFDKAAQTGQKLFAYFFTEFNPANDPSNGVSHGSELAFIFGTAPAVENNLSTIFTDAYINFVNDLNPGSFWPRYNLKDKPVLQFMQGNVTVIADDFFIEKTNFHNSAKVMDEFEK